MVIYHIKLLEKMNGWIGIFAEAKIEIFMSPILGV